MSATHVPMLTNDAGYTIKGILRCKHCGLSEIYWHRWACHRVTMLEYLEQSYTTKMQACAPGAPLMIYFDEWYNLKNSRMAAASTWPADNDNNKASFEEIAGIIESRPEGLFREEL